MGEIVIVVLGSFAAVVAICWAGVEIANVVSRSRTRRDVLAYVAEGTISPEDAAKLIELAERADLRRKVLRTADWDSDWDRWRQTVKEVFGDDFGKPESAKPAEARA